jgi:hypothetical protein
MIKMEDGITQPVRSCDVPYMKGVPEMNSSELGWRLHKAAIDKTLNLSTREACIDAARKLHEIERMIRRADWISQESLIRIKLIMHR